MLKNFKQRMTSKAIEIKKFLKHLWRLENVNGIQAESFLL